MALSGIPTKVNKVQNVGVLKDELRLGEVPRRTKRQPVSKGVKKDRLLSRNLPKPSSQQALLVGHEFQGRNFSTVIRDGAAWFIAADVCAALEHKNPRQAISRLHEDEKGVLTVDTPGGCQEVNVINESGLYALISTSRKPVAQLFRRWVTGEVLPSIRKTGRYSMPGQAIAAGQPSFAEFGRYIVMVTPGDPLHVQHNRLETLVSDVTENDCALLALALKTAEGWWHKTEQLASIGLETQGSFAAKGLERAVRDGAELADRILNSQRQEQARQEGRSTVSKKT